VDNDIDELNYCTYLWIKNCFIIITMLRQLIIVWEVRRSVNNGCIQSDSSISELMETRSNLDDVIACWMHTVLPERISNEGHFRSRCWTRWGMWATTARLYRVNEGVNWAISYVIMGTLLRQRICLQKADTFGVEWTISTLNQRCLVQRLVKH